VRTPRREVGVSSAPSALQRCRRSPACCARSRFISRQRRRAGRQRRRRRAGRRRRPNFFAKLQKLTLDSPVFSQKMTPTPFDYDQAEVNSKMALNKRAFSLIFLFLFFVF
jgi:hypothetical protein